MKPKYSSSQALVLLATAQVIWGNTEFKGFPWGHFCVKDPKRNRGSWFLRLTCMLL